jgi:ATP-dependent RNA helicase DeaD
MKLAHQATAPESDEREIPNATVKDRKKKTEGFDRQGDRKGKRDRTARPDSDRVRLYVSGGKSAGIRPKDLVGAIAGESGLAGRDIGPIDIQDRFSLVSVPSDKVDHVIDSMRGVTLRGKKLTFRRERY